MKLSKARYLAGLRCDKALWLRVHDAGARELSVDGAATPLPSRVRMLAMARACFPSGVSIEGRHELAEAQTQGALATAATLLFAASFTHQRVHVVIDVLQQTRAAHGGLGGWVLIAIKASNALKPRHLTELALQTYVARGAGLPVERVELMHLNRRHRHPDTGPLFVREDVTEAVLARLPVVEPEITRQLHVLQHDCPEAQVGRHCNSPRPCAWKPRCWPARPPHDVSELHGGGHVLQRLQELGYRSIAEIPDSVRLPAIARRQRRAVQRGELVLEPGLSSALAPLSAGLAFLDFECIAPAVPLWPACAPQQHVPVQFSVHRLSPTGQVVHHAFLAQGQDDPRPSLAQALLSATLDATAVVAWSMAFERACILQLAAALPEQRHALRALSSKLHDLLPIVRSHVYHPDFRGSFSLKRVAPALIPELAYRDLEIADGGTAAGVLEALILQPQALPDAEQTRLRNALLAYCERDTWALVRIYQWLRERTDTCATPEAVEPP